MKKHLLLFGLLAVLFASCEKKEESYDCKAVNTCVYEIMDTYYLWNREMPQQRKLNFDDEPDVFFDKLLYSADHWSFIDDDSESTNAQLEGSPYSMGYSPQFHLYDGGEHVLILVEFVYPGSPADLAGLKRGDIILDINGTPLTPKNYYDLYQEKKATYTCATYDASTNTLNETGKLTMEATVVKADPSIYDTIFYVGNKPVGYYVFTAFASDKSYLATMDNVFDKFKEAGVKDLILDLRYNGGGDIGVASHLASAIAPANVVKNHNVLVTYVYNDLLTSYFEEDEDEILVRFPDNDYNADIENLYVLCTEGTASASELVAIGLEPYMNVKLIGTNTYGKYTGMFIFDKDVRGCKDLENWILLPVCMKYANSEGFSDFVDGLEPDYKVEDDLLSGYQFGDANDPMLATALDVIGGLPLTAKAARVKPFESLGRDRSIVGNNLIIRPSSLR